MGDERLLERANEVIPGGVNSPVRAFNGVGGEPIFFKEGRGSKLIAENGQEYIDYVGSWGPLILGHAHPSVIEAVQQTVRKGLSFGAPTKLEVVLAELLCSLLPDVDKVRMVNSGTEATMTALRLARGITGREKILKFDGCYHGHSDSLLSNAGSGVLTLGLPSCPGVPKANAELTLTASFNDLDGLEELMAVHGETLAAVIIEPVAGNMGCILPKDGFLERLRTLCSQHGALLIFDEVMTGFRVGLTGAAGFYGIRPDLSTFGKVIGGGMPVGAIAGAARYMDHLAPLGPVYQAGTLSGNPVAMAAGLANLKEIAKPGFYQALTDKTAYLLKGLEEVAKASNIPFTTSMAGGMFGLAFSDRPISSFAEIKQSNIERFKAFFHGMLQEGIYLAPSAFEAGFVSSAHSSEDLDATIEAAARVFATL